MTEMKLFHWYKVLELKDYGYGNCIVMAKNLEEAMKKIKDNEHFKIWKEIRDNPKENLDILEGKDAIINIMGSA